MKRCLFFLTLFLCSLFLGCGSQGGSSTSSSDDTTTTVSVAAIQMSATTSTIKTDETTNITVTLLTSSGQLVSGSATITFTLDAPALGSIAATATTSTGTTTQTFAARSTEGTVTITATVGSITATKTIQISNQTAPSTITLTSNPASVTVGGTSVLSALVKDSTGTAMPSGTSVNFTVDNENLGTITSSASTNSSGIAQVTFEAGDTTAGTATITASAGSATGTGTVIVTGAPAGSIESVQPNPQIIAIKGAGGVETTEIKFLVKDSNGSPTINAETVRLVLSGPNGGEYLGDTAGTTTLDVGTVNGFASAFLHSGTTPGTATVTATIVDSSPTLSTSSGVIAIGGGTPSAGRFSLSVDKLNLPGYTVDNLENTITTLIADRFGNYNVLTGTTVSYYTECGAIDRAVALNSTGHGTVTFRTQTPRPYVTTPDPLGTVSGSCGARCNEENSFISAYKSAFNVNIAALATVGGGSPRAGLCTVTALVDGEEKFTDSNGNGLYNSGEPVVDTYDDINIEMDDDEISIDPVSAGRPHDPTFEDLVVDRDKDGTFDGYNAVWDSNKRIAKRIDILITDDDLFLVTNKNSFIVPNGGSDTITFALHDLNYNRPSSGNTLTVAFTGTGTLTGSTSINFADSSVLGTGIDTVTISDSDSATNVPTAGSLKFTFSSGGVSQIVTIGGTTN